MRVRGVAGGTASSVVEGVAGDVSDLEVEVVVAVRRSCSVDVVGVDVIDVVDVVNTETAVVWLSINWAEVSVDWTEVSVSNTTPPAPLDSSEDESSDIDKFARTGISVSTAVSSSTGRKAHPAPSKSVAMSIADRFTEVLFFSFIVLSKPTFAGQL